MTHLAEPWSYQPPQIDLDENAKLRAAVIELLDTVEFKMSGTLDSDRRMIGYRTARALDKVRNVIYKPVPFGISCNENSNELPLSSSATGSTVPLNSPVVQ